MLSFLVGIVGLVWCLKLKRLDDFPSREAETMKDHVARSLPTPATVAGNFDNTEAIFDNAGMEFVRASKFHRPYASLLLGLRPLR